MRTKYVLSKEWRARPWRFHRRDRFDVSDAMSRCKFWNNSRLRVLVAQYDTANKSNKIPVFQAVETVAR